MISTILRRLHEGRASWLPMMLPQVLLCAAAVADEQPAGNANQSAERTAAEARSAAARATAELRIWELRLKDDVSASFYLNALPADAK